MAQMKSMSQLSAAIEDTIIPSDVAVLQKLLSSLTAATTALNALPAEYSRAYSQVQLLKYDSNNDPTDVTPAESLTIPDSVISRYRQSWENIKENIRSLKGQLEEFTFQEALNPGTLRVQNKATSHIYNLPGDSVVDGAAVDTIAVEDNGNVKRLSDLIAEHFLRTYSQLKAQGMTNALIRAQFCTFIFAPLLLNDHGLFKILSLGLIRSVGNSANYYIVARVDNSFCISQALASSPTDADILSSFTNCNFQPYTQGNSTMFPARWIIGYPNAINWSDSNSITITNAQDATVLEPEYSVEAAADTSQFIGAQISESIDLTALDSALAQL